MSSNFYGGKYLLAFLSAYSFLIVGCGVPGKDDVVGVYKRSFKGARESLVIISNGIHRQTIRFADGQTWATNGTWDLKGTTIFVHDYYKTYDMEKNTIIEPPFLMSMTPFAVSWGQLIREYEPIWEKQ